jgi:hypothetical protein
MTQRMMHVYCLCIELCILFSCRSEPVDNRKEETETLFYPTNTKDLEDSVKVIELTYIGFFCQCANWITENDYTNHNDSLQNHSIFIEPIEPTSKLPDTLGYPGDLIRFTGKFYKDKGYPKNYPITEMQVEKARVFRYDNYEVLCSNYSDYKE